MRSMTGLGVGSARGNGCVLRAEIRSVNHRFLDLSLRLPSQLSDAEPAIRELLSGAIDRGRVTLSVELERGREAVEFQVNEGFVENYVKSARRLAKRHKLAKEISVDRVLALPEAIVVRERDLPIKQLRELLEKSVRQALQRFQRMREKEGKALHRELSKRVAVLEKETRSVQKHAGEVPKEIRRRMEDRIRSIGAEHAVDPSRLAAEVALLVDRASITEELERLASHTQQFKESLSAKEPVAKRLGFLLQEMHREVNTTGSKSNHLGITRSVLRMKEELESLREQIQNLE